MLLLLELHAELIKQVFVNKDLNFSLTMNILLIFCLQIQLLGFGFKLQ